MKPKKQRQDQWESFLVDCTLEDMSRLLMSPPVTLRSTTGLTGKMCARVSVAHLGANKYDECAGDKLPMWVIHQQLRYSIRQAENCDLKPFLLFFNACTCAKSAWPYNHVSSLGGGEKNILPASALFRTTQPPIPQAVHLREKCAMWLHKHLSTNVCVRERTESCGDAEQVWHMGSQHPSSLCPQRSHPARKKQNKVTSENTPLLRICTNAP